MSGRRVLVPALVAGLLGAGLVVALLDQRERAAEDRALSVCEEGAYAAAIRTDQVLGSMAAYIAPSLAEREGLWALMSEAAAQAAPTLEAALARCESVQVLGLHRTHVRERAAYLDYLRARGEQVAAIVTDGRAAAESDPALARLREAAFPDRP